MSVEAPLQGSCAQNQASAPPGLHQQLSTDAPLLAQAPATSAAASGSELPASLLQGLVEDSMLQHLELVRAAATGADLPGPIIARSRVGTWQELAQILRHLAYATDAQCPWRRLGFGLLEGPDPSLQTIETRTKSARLLCSAAKAGEWTQADREAAMHALGQIEVAGEICAMQLPELLRERRRIKPSKLPLWMELGSKALAVLRSTSLDTTEVVATQWSRLLPDTESAMHADPGVLPADEARQLAMWAEQGDARLWIGLAGRPAVLWAPPDPSGLGRLMSAFMKTATARGSPPHLRLISPMDLYPGCHDVNSI